MNNDILIIITWLFALLLGLVFLLQIANNAANSANDLNKCLDPIAKEYCEENDMFYYDGKSYSTHFYCFDDQRASVGEKFNYLKEETENCKKFLKGEQDE